MARKTTLLVSIGALAALAAAGLLVAYFVGTDSDADQEAAGGGVPIRGPLLATNRSILSVCIDGALGYDASEEDADWLRQALDGALDAFPDTPAEFAQREAVLGCPAPSAALMGDSAHPLDDAREGVRVELSGPHRLFVYLLPPEQYAARSTLPYVVGNGEYIVEGDYGRPVSAALYITPAIPPETLREALLSALGLQQPVSPRSTEEWQRGVCELGTPAPWCAMFED